MPGLEPSDGVVLALAATSVLALLLLGAVERIRHRRAVERVPLRISVNGSRGKSTVVRLLSGALASGGYRPLGKITGTEPRLLHGWSGEEVVTRRRPEGPNIGEQRKVMREAVRLEADAVVAECMAVTPEYQGTFNEELLGANVLVITNVLDDHLDVMGPTPADVADVFAATIPAGGVVVAAPGPHLERFRAVAERRGATLLETDPDGIEADLLAGFDHFVFAEQVAAVVALAEHLGIPRDRVMEGMRQAPADPFATRLLPVGDPHAPATFVNAFPANDPTSTLAVWEHLRARGFSADKLVVIMNCRGDRVARTKQFAREVLPVLPIDTLLVVGQEGKPVLRAVDRGEVVVRELRDATGRSAYEAVAELDDELRDRVVLAVGNLQGAGRDVVDAFEQRTVALGVG